MTQEEKQLLLKDLCARLLYRPKGVRLSMVFDPKDITIVGYNGRFVETVDTEVEVERVRLYLRPMSSMTAEEREEIEVFICDEWFVDDDKATKVDSEGFIEFLSNYDCSGIYPEFCGQYVDWLLSHHFDYRGLIEKGLALEAPEGMYKEN